MFRKISTQNQDTAASEQLNRDVEQILGEMASSEISIASNVFSKHYGIRTSKARGEDGDWTDLREWTPGEDMRTIHHRATARSGGETLISKVNQPERQGTYCLIVNVGSTLDFGHDSETKRWLTARLIAATLKALTRTLDLVHITLYHEDGIFIMPKPLEPRQVLRSTIEKVLSPWHSSLFESRNLAQAIKLLSTIQGEKLVISDFFEWSQPAAEAFQLLAAGRNRSVRAVFVEDERERNLPEPTGLPFLARFFSPLRLVDLSTGKLTVVANTRKNRRLYAEAFKRQRSSIETVFNDSGIKYATAQTGDPQVMQAFFQLLA